MGSRVRDGVTYPLIRTTKASLGSAGTKRALSLFAARLASITSRSALTYSWWYFSARLKMVSRFFLLA
jgi:hypothetical protein